MPMQGLLYVQVKVNDIEVMAMINFGATYNFVVDRKTVRLKLALTKSFHAIKIVNSSK